MKEPTFVDRDGFAVLGLEEPMAVAESDHFQGIWKRFMDYHDTVAAHSTNGCYYGVASATDDLKDMLYMAGMAVPEDTPCPEGLTLRHIPAARYAVFECTVATISDTWEHIHRRWFDESSCVHGHPHPDFEQYPPGTDSDQSPVLIHVPVTKADD